jgi:YggT family protein
MGSVVLGQITETIAWMLNSLLWMYWWIVLGSVIVSWVNADPYNPIVRFLRTVTEPVFYRIRRALPFIVFQGFDLSPIVVFFGIEAVRRVLVVSLHQLAQRLTYGGGLG